MVRYKMLGRDINSFPTQYRTWVVSDYPDFDGHYYTGLKSGTSPFVDVSAYEIQDDGYVVDFNLPDPLNWTPVLGTMPTAVYDSQLAIIDGYAYLFGGTRSNKIWKMDLNNPATWWDTGATLPTTLGSSCLTIVDGYIYLFGGIGGVDEETLDVIYSAPVDDPLNWIDTGAILPEKVRKQQIAVVGNYIYLFGGIDLNHARDFIWRAPITDPLDWTDTGNTLPYPLYASVIAILDNHLYLLGGLKTDDHAVSDIMSAPLSNPLLWTVAADLPYACSSGQFLTIGNVAYLYTQANVGNPQPCKTRIFRCQKDDPLMWEDTELVLPGDLHESQFGIVYDRIWAFGGNGISALFTCNQFLKYHVANSKVMQYGQVTRTDYQAITDPILKTQLLGFPYWKTDYKP